MLRPIVYRPLSIVLKQPGTAKRVQIGRRAKQAGVSSHTTQRVGAFIANAAMHQRTAPLLVVLGRRNPPQQRWRWAKHGIVQPKWVNHQIAQRNIKWCAL